MTMNIPSPPATTARTDTFRIRVLVVMGVSGCGKTAVGRAVAEAWGVGFEDADHWHTPEAVATMASGVPLTDEDRAPWLARLREKVIGAVPRGSRGVLACSALKRRYREALKGDQENVQFVYLSGTQELIATRLAARKGHYMPAGLLDSQFAALEEPGPDEALIVSIDQPLEAVVDEILRLTA